MSLDMVLYPFVASLTLDASSGNVVGGATGSVYAKADTTFTTPLAAVDASGNPVTLTSNANGVLPSFYVDGHTSVNWVSGSWVFPLVTSEPVEGPEGPAGVSVNGATATGDDLVFSLSNGSTTPPVKMPTAPGGSDSGVASYITTPGTETATALSATIAEGLDPVEEAVGYGTKLGAFSFGGGGGASSLTNITEMIIRAPFRLPVKPTRARLHVQNRNLKDNLGLTAGAFNFTGLWIGKPIVDAAGALTANFTAAPIKVLEAFATPADGTEYVSPWFDTSALIDAKTDYALSYGYTNASGQTTHRATGFHWWSNIPGDAAKAGNQAMVGTVTTNKSPHLDIWLEYEFEATNPVNLYVGDSLTDGQGALWGTRDSYPQLHSRQTGAAAVVLAFSGSSLSPGWDVTSPKYGKYSGLSFDAMYVHLGTNDIQNGADLATIQARLGITLDKLRSTYGPTIPVYLGIVPPRGFAATPEAVRVSYNTWLRTLPFGVAGTMDFDRAVRSPSNLTVLDADFNSGDGTHMNTAGYDKMARTTPLVIAAS